VKNLIFIFFTLVFAVVISFAISPITAYASGEIRVTIDGQQVTFADQPPITIDGRVLAPISSVFAQLGFAPSWDGDTWQATLTRADYTIVITIGSTEFTTNGVSHTLDVPARLVAGRTMVPLRPILESVGYEIGWEDITTTVQIATSPSPLVGTWDWAFMGLYTRHYVFNANGTGYMLFDGEMMAINWEAVGGILSICITPEECGATCVAPSDWYYEINGNTLVLRNTVQPDMEFTYVRA